MNPDQDGFVGGTPVILLDQDFKMLSIIGGVSEKYRFAAETLTLTQPERPASNFSPSPKRYGAPPQNPFIAALAGEGKGRQ